MNIAKQILRGMQGPASSVDNEIFIADGTTGKKIQGGTGITVVGGVIIGAYQKIPEIIQAVTDTLTAAEVFGTIINNYGQGAADNLQSLPTTAEGMNFVAICGTAQAANYFRFQADTSDKIYLDGVAGSDNGYVTIAAPVVGALLQFFTFKTGAGVYDWYVNVINGNWIAG